MGKMVKVSSVALSIFMLMMTSGVANEPLSLLLEQGIYAEETQGDLKKAIEHYDRLIQQHDESNSYVFSNFLSFYIDAMIDNDSRYCKEKIPEKRIEPMQSRKLEHPQYSVVLFQGCPEARVPESIPHRHGNAHDDK